MTGPSPDWVGNRHHDDREGPDGVWNGPRPCSRLLWHPMREDLGQPVAPQPRYGRGKLFYPRYGAIEVRGNRPHGLTLLHKPPLDDPIELLQQGNHVPDVAHGPTYLNAVGLNNGAEGAEGTHRPRPIEPQPVGVGRLAVVLVSFQNAVFIVPPGGPLVARHPSVNQFLPVHGYVSRKYVDPTIEIPPTDQNSPFA